MTRAETIWKQDLKGPWAVVCEDGNLYADAHDHGASLTREDAILWVTTANRECECKRSHRAMPKSWASKLGLVEAMQPEFLGGG